MTFHSHLPHISDIWVTNPIFFITTCTYQRKPILHNELITKILIEEWRNAMILHGWMVGRFVIMPDHVHFFCSFVDCVKDSHHKNLSGFMQQWKQWTSKRILREFKDERTKLSAPVWQKEFFDYLLRTEESYRQKWEYVRMNPVRKNLVQKAEDWLWQGEIADLFVHSM